MRTRRHLAIGTLVVLGALALSSLPALALTPYDVPTISCGTSGENQITVKICGGASGAPAGVTLQWKKLSDYLINGWSDNGDLCALSLSGQPSLQHPGKSRWELGSFECEDITIGDINFDETGVSGTGCGLEALECGTDYVFRIFAHAGRGFGRSDFSENLTCSTLPCPNPECTFTQGYWKNHGPVGCASGNNSNVWPVSSLTLGNVSYTDLQLCSIFNQPAQGNGLISLAHQLIAAKLNAGTGATCAQSTIDAADALIGNKVVPPVGSGFLAPGVTSSLTNDLNTYNNGLGCAETCEGNKVQKFGAQSAKKSVWGTVKVKYR